MEEGKIAAQFTVAHTADGIAGLARRLAKFGDPADVPVAIERPNGRLVDLLLEAGHPCRARQAERDQGLAGRGGSRPAPSPTPGTPP